MPSCPAAILSTPAPAALTSKSWILTPRVPRHIVLNFSSILYFKNCFPLVYSWYTWPCYFLSSESNNCLKHAGLVQNSLWSGMKISGLWKSPSLIPQFPLSNLHRSKMFLGWHSGLKACLFLLNQLLKSWLTTKGLYDFINLMFLWLWLFIKIAEKWVTAFLRLKFHWECFVDTKGRL